MRLASATNPRDTNSAPTILASFIEVASSGWHLIAK